MPPAYYEVCDILGLIYNNPILLSRLSQHRLSVAGSDRNSGHRNRRRV